MKTTTEIESAFPYMNAKEIFVEEVFSLLTDEQRDELRERIPEEGEPSEETFADADSIKPRCCVCGWGLAGYRKGIYQEIREVDNRKLLCKNCLTVNHVTIFPRSDGSFVVSVCSAASAARALAGSWRRLLP